MKLFKSDNLSTYASCWIVFLQFIFYIQCGYTSMVLNPTAESFKSFINYTSMENDGKLLSSSHLTLLLDLSQGAIFIGAIFGALLSFSLVSKLRRVVKNNCVFFNSRKKNLIIIQVLLLIGNLATFLFFSALHKIEIFISGRLLQGITRGMTSNCLSLFIAEMCERKTLYFYQGYLRLSFFITGKIIASVLGHPSILGQMEKLQFLFAIPLIFSLLFFVFLPWITETPAYLALSETNMTDYKSLSPPSDCSPSFKLLSKLRKTSINDIKQEHQLMLEEVKSELFLEHTTLYQLLTIPRYKKLFYICLSIPFFQTSGYTIIFLYSSTFLSEIGIGINQSASYTIGFMCATFFAAIVTSWMSKYFGTHHITLGASVVAIFSQILLTLTEFLKKYVQTSTYSGLYITATMVLLLSSCGIVQSVYVAPAEVSTIVSRPLVLKIISIGAFSVNSVISLTAPIIFNKFGGYGWIFYTIFLVPSVILFKILVPNTFNKNYKEIQEEFDK